MRSCPQCGRRGIFLPLTQEGICKKCSNKNDELIKEAEDRSASDYINSVSGNLKTALEHTTVILPNWGLKQIKEIQDAATAAMNDLGKWVDYPAFERVFFSMARKERIDWVVDAWKCSLRSLDRDTMASWVEKTTKVLQDVESKCISASLKAYDYSQIFTVVGVTFKNGRRNRQTILRQIRFHDGAYKREPEFRLEHYFYEDEDAFAVYANAEQVGNISRNDVPWLMVHIDEYFGVGDYDVTGGNGYNFGLQIRVTFRKKSDGD